MRNSSSIHGDGVYVMLCFSIHHIPAWHGYLSPVCPPSPDSTHTPHLPYPSPDATLQGAPYLSQPHPHSPEGGATLPYTYTADMSLPTGQSSCVYSTRDPTAATGYGACPQAPGTGYPCAAPYMYTPLSGHSLQDPGTTQH